MLINCVIVEDEPLAVTRLRDYISKISFLNLVNVFDNGIEAIGFLGGNKIDLIFLDIQMNDFSGIQLLESIDTKASVIITTAFDGYAIKGFELSVSDYLLKPYTFERFTQAVLKVRDRMMVQPSPEPSCIFVKTEYRLEKVFLDQILYIEGMRDYRQINTSVKKIMTLETFREFEKVLPSKIFCRVHKSFIVSINKIDTVERDRIKINNKIIPVSETFKDNFYSMIS